MTLSITDDGPDPDTLAEQELELTTEFLAAFPPVGDEFLDTSPDSYTGREITVMSEQLVTLQNLIVSFTELLDPAQAQGVFVDFHLGLQSTRRTAASFSKISARAIGLPNLDIGDKRVRFTPNSTVWRTPVGLNTGATGVVTFDATATVAGPITAVAAGASSWVIVDEVTGWDTFESLDAPDLGSAVESDEAARGRLDATPIGVGVATKPGIIRALLKRPGVTLADIDNNRKLVPNANGVPAKSIEAIVEGGTDQDIGNTTLETYQGTAGYFGNTEVQAVTTVELPDGTPITVTELSKFTRIFLIPVIARYTISFTGDLSKVPLNVVDLAKQVAESYVNGAGRETDVLPTASASAVETSLPAETEPTVVGEVAYAGDPLGFVPLTIGSRERGSINSSPQAAFVLGTAAEPFNFDVSWTLDLAINGGPGVTITFAVTDFQIVSQAQAFEVATVISAQASGLTAGVQSGALTMKTDQAGAGTSILVSATSSVALLTTLGLVASTTLGSDGDIVIVLA